MSNISVKVAIALFMVLTPPAASFARGGHGGGPAGSAAMGGFPRPAGSAATGNVPISGIARGPANAGGMNNATVDPADASYCARRWAYYDAASGKYMGDDGEWRPCP
jgi:hypothetical protein